MFRVRAFEDGPFCPVVIPSILVGDTGICSARVSAETCTSALQPAGI